MLKKLLALALLGAVVVPFVATTGPTATAVGVTQLLDPMWLIEIDGIAVLEDVP